MLSIKSDADDAAAAAAASAAAPAAANVIAFDTIYYHVFTD